MFLAPVLLDEAASVSQSNPIKQKTPKDHHHKIPVRRLPDFFPSMGQGLPNFNQYNMPGSTMDPLLYSSPFFPRYGSQAMLPPPPAIFHYGELPIQSIYALHYPTAFTPNSLYGLPHAYNPYFGMNMPYSNMHHPYAAQIVNNLAYMNQNMAGPGFGPGGFPGPAAGYSAGFAGAPALRPANMMGFQDTRSNGLRRLEQLTEQPLPKVKLDKKMIQRFLKEQEKHFARTIVKELAGLQQAIKGPKAI